MQELARQAIERMLRNPDGPAAALVAIDLKTGGVKAMFGGRNFRESQFNLAAQAKRQPGSAFKPIVLATAMAPGDLAADRARVEEGLHRRRRPHLDGDELRPHVPRSREPRARAGLVRQHGLRAAHGSRRARRRSSRRPTSSASGARSTRTSRSGSARSRSTRSRWRAHTRRSGTQGAASTARSSATRRASSSPSSGSARVASTTTSPSRPR